MCIVLKHQKREKISRTRLKCKLKFDHDSFIYARKLNHLTHTKKKNIIGYHYMPSWQTAKIVKYVKYKLIYYTLIFFKRFSGILSI